MTALWAEIATSSTSLVSQGASLSPFSTAKWCKDRAGGLVRGAEVLSEALACSAHPRPGEGLAFGGPWAPSMLQTPRSPGLTWLGPAYPLTLD